MSFRPGPRNLITDVDGLLVGNAEDARLRSGVSVVLGETPFVASVDVRGGAPGTRETDLLDPSCRVDRVDAICLSRRLGLRPRASDGVMRWLRERGRGLAVGGAVVPIVPTRDPVRPAEWRRQGLGLAALSRARLSGDRQAPAPDFALGNAGAGLGAKAGNLKGGLGSGVGGRSGDRPAGRRAGRGQCARLHDHGRHAAILGLGAGAGRRVRRPAAAGRTVSRSTSRTIAPTSATIRPMPRAAIRAPTPPSPWSRPTPGSTRARRSGWR